MQRRGLAAVLLAALVAVFAGCGSDSDEFVAVSSNNTGGPVAGSGELAFRFERTNPQTVAPVPQATVTLRFDLYSTTPPTPDTLVFTQSQPYSDQIVLREVPTTAITPKQTVTAERRINFPSLTAKPKARLRIGSMRGATIMAPMTTAVLLETSPRVAITAELISRMKKPSDGLEEAIRAS